MPADVVAEVPGQVIDAFFFDQAVGCVVGKLVSRIVFVNQRGEANRRVVFVADALALGVLAAARQAAGGAQQARGLAFAVGVRQHLVEGVVGERFGAAVRVMDAQHFAVGLAFQGGGLVQGVGDGDEFAFGVVAILYQCLDGVIVYDAFDIAQST